MSSNDHGNSRRARPKPARLNAKTRSRESITAKSRSERLYVGSPNRGASVNATGSPFRSRPFDASSPPAAQQWNRRWPNWEIRFRNQERSTTAESPITQPREPIPPQHGSGVAADPIERANSEPRVQHDSGVAANPIKRADPPATRHSLWSEIIRTFTSVWRRRRPKKMIANPKGPEWKTIADPKGPAWRQTAK